MKNERLEQYQKVLEGAFSLSELKERFPAQWESLSAELTPLCRSSESSRLAAAIQRISREADARHSRVVKSRGNTAVLAVALPFVVRHQMVRLWLTSSYLSSVAGEGTDGKARLSLWDGFLIQRLLFLRGLERRCVSRTWFRILWPLIRRKQRSLMLYLVQQKGIYCFYSNELIKGLAALIAGRPCVEIAAGDGTLTRLLREAGVAIRATDNHAWAKDIQYPDFVEKINAEDALRKYAPRVVICSWPPAENTFEKSVFACPSVDLYIVLASRKTFASGNWDAYGRQKEFRKEEAVALSRGLLPPEVEGAVWVFRRDPAACC